MKVASPLSIETCVIWLQKMQKLEDKIVSIDGQLVTLVCCFSVSGVYVPPVMIFPPKKNVRQIIFWSSKWNSNFEMLYRIYEYRFFVQWLRHLKQEILGITNMPTFSKYAYNKQYLIPSPQYKISYKYTNRFKWFTHLRSLYARHFVMVEATALNSMESKWSSMSSPPYNISSKSVHKGFLWTHLRSLNVLHFGMAEAMKF
jgi:hypothetical protein